MLWSIKTTPNRSTGYTPFFMVYHAKAVLPCDIIHDSPRVRMYEEREAELMLNQAFLGKTKDNPYLSLLSFLFSGAELKKMELPGDEQI
ncbi:hypothetical protein ACR2XV_25805 [Klebsiella pneumoniae]